LMPTSLAFWAALEDASSQRTTPRISRNRISERLLRNVLFTCKSDHHVFSRR
jgi:hypothetical protein